MTSKVKVKICGITNLIDAKNALSLGADFIGFNNIESSPRFLTVEQIKQILLDLNEGEKQKAVFVSSDALVDNITEICSGLNIKNIQPYGEYKPKDLRSLSLLGYQIFKPLQVASQEDLKDLPSFEDFVNVAILDAKSASEPDKLGGTGELFDWSIFKAAKDLTGMNLALAGGLNPDNISEAVKETNPYMVDIASGLEDRPGLKSLDKMKNFFAQLS